MLAYSDGNHYDSVYSTQYMDDTAFCQGQWCIHGSPPLGSTVSCNLGLLYNLLMEKVFGVKVPVHCKRKLKQLHDSDLDSIAEYRRDKRYPFQSKDPDARALFNLSKYYGEDEVVAMSWTLHHNAALSLHRSEKESKSDVNSVVVCPYGQSMNNLPIDIHTFLVCS